MKGLSVICNETCPVLDRDQPSISRMHAYVEDELGLAGIVRCKHGRKSILGSIRNREVLFP